MDLQTTNIWLAIIAVASVLQIVLVLAVAFYLTQLARRAQQTIDTVAAEARPLVRQVSAALNEVAELVDRTRRAEASVTALVDRVSTTVDRVSTSVDRVKTVALTKVWPAVGIARGLRAAAAALRERRRRKSATVQLDDVAESRFVDEGGANARSIRTR